MSERIEYLSFADGDVLPIDARSPLAADSPFEVPPQPVARDTDRDLGRRLTESAEDALERIRRFGTLAAERFADMPQQPDKVIVQLAVVVSAEVGVVLAKSAGSANLTITVEWNREGAARTG
ncbi:hypothetical protein GA0070622_2783 [Micromonospora sediminicola]|uniref:Trypsin-co-occurring domain-containing protein n=1 Tax=Micromonospora sediminicola TaxID=946078 RepID=A0A1A9B9X2_9ACTN|nr:CU044_2847 family protein [Micromonospora sediminicola]SBT65774.1 hypothetical protein GA0070622_2783 [Micromonospora sediminicola]